MKRMKYWMFLAALSAVLGDIPVAQAQDCRYYQNKVEHYTNLRRKGGTDRQMTNWQRERNRYNNLYQGCKRSSGNAGAIERVGGQGRNRSYADPRSERSINTNNQVVRRLIETCNFWTREHNKQPTEATLTQRNYACREADRGQRSSNALEPTHITHTRTLSECMKPDNVVDNEVSACLQGELEPYWSQN